MLFKPFVKVHISAVRSSRCELFIIVINIELRHEFMCQLHCVDSWDAEDGREIT